MMKMNTRGNVLQVVLVLAIVSILAGLIGFFAGRSAGKHEERSDVKKREALQSSEGAWGKIRYWNSILEMPGDMISIQSMPNAKTKWYFGVNTPADVVKIMTDCAVSESVARRIAATAQESAGGGLLVTPEDGEVIQISAHSRSMLYPIMSRWPQNQAMADATRFTKVGKRDWLDEAPISPEISKLVRSLIYSNGETELFVDYEVVLRRMTDNREARDFLRTMARRNCIMGTLVVRPEDNINDLVRYWGRGGREQEVRTLIEAANMSEGSHEIPLIMLMPPFVRDRLYRYRRASDPDLANCHFSSMNFFNDAADNSFTNLATCGAAIDSSYYTVTDGNYQLGDVIMMMISENEVIHTCNYIAGNIAFTKNGSSQGQPWTLGDLTEIERFFGVEKPLIRRIVRKKDFAGPAI